MATIMAQPEAFKFTATGILGEKRDTMLENELLLRCQLSQPMKRGYTRYPGQSFRYGKPNAIRNGGAAEDLSIPSHYCPAKETLLKRFMHGQPVIVWCDRVKDSEENLSALSGWPVSSKGPYFHKKSAGKEIQPGRDFIALNRSAADAGLTTSRQQSDFRATHDIRRKIQSESTSCKRKTTRVPASMTFGVATRPSTPIHDLLEFKYQDRWLEERQATEFLKQSKEKSKKLDSRKVYSTRANMIRNHLAPIQQPDVWHLPKFSNKASPQLETFRSASAKERSFSHHQQDRNGRQGIAGHGMPEPAIN